MTPTRNFFTLGIITTAIGDRPRDRYRLPAVGTRSTFGEGSKSGHQFSESRKPSRKPKAEASDPFSFTLPTATGRSPRCRPDRPWRVETPVFMPVGTQGMVKAVTARSARRAGRVGHSRQHLPPVSAAGRRSHRPPRRACIGSSAGLIPCSPTAADIRCSVSLHGEESRKQGVHFRSHLDGSGALLTPEKAVDMQVQLGSDIAMVLDECPALRRPPRRSARPSSSQHGGRGAVGSDSCRCATGRVGELCVTNAGQAQFGIVQGGASPEFRARSAELTLEVGFEGYAIGGLSVGEANEEMYKVVELTAPLLPADGPAISWASGRHWISSRPWRAASTCSTACYPRAMRATVSSSRARARSTSRTPNMPRMMGQPIRRATAPPAGAIRARTCAIFSLPARSPQAPLTRCIICTFTLTPCGGLGRLYRLGRSKSSDRCSIGRFSRRSLTP